MPVFLHAFTACLIGIGCFLTGCAIPVRDNITDNIAQRVDSLFPADVILLGEQHDAPDHHRLERALVLELAQRQQLSAVVLEMADRGRTTSGLARNASDADARLALQWDEASWAWNDYGPVVMAAVQNGVPVLGANLPRAAMRTAMADETLDVRLSTTSLAQQRDNIRAGHCMMLPESQIAPMTRIQVARDVAMAETVVSASQSGKTVVLVAGGGHVSRGLGVPVHLPDSTLVKVVLAVAGPADLDRLSGADVIWETPAMPAKDHCADFQKQMRP